LWTRKNNDGERGKISKMGHVRGEIKKRDKISEGGCAKDKAGHGWANVKCVEKSKNAVKYRKRMCKR